MPTTSSPWLADLILHGQDKSGRKAVMKKIKNHSYSDSPKDFVFRFGFQDDVSQGGRNETHMTPPDLSFYSMRPDVTLKKTAALVFVVDASLPASKLLSDAKPLLQTLCKQFANAPIAIVANKQDKQGALGIAEVIQALELDTVCFGHSYQVYLAAAKSESTGLENVVPWLHEQMNAMQ